MDSIRSLLKSSLARGLQGLGERDKLELAWVALCGTALAARSAVVGYEAGIVTIEVSERSWLEQIRDLGQNLAP
jgi:hypothetical protein